ncbi:hypothetical protein Daesc_007221 [Daldinia eschscholtzii]|uniref:Uncharacterized protein n=1 Tax=Daldinia eschscholtzii TaxID=292717 RepID=A0AAX6ME39_9PEZI
MKFLSYTAFGALLATTTLAQDVSGSGQIHVVKSSNLQDALPENTIGCLNAQGLFTETDCATFTIRDPKPLTLFLSSEAGSCTFQDSTQPANTDSVYGSRLHSHVCREDYETKDVDAFYTLNGLDNFLCRGNLNCFYDVKIESGDNATSPVWEFAWGSQQRDVAEGHTMVMWYWSKV